MSYLPFESLLERLEGEFVVAAGRLQSEDTLA